MRDRNETHPALKSRMEVIDRRVRRTRRRLDHEVRLATATLDIQEDVGISNIRGDILILSREDRIHRRIETVLNSEGFHCDSAHHGEEAIGFLKIGKYRMVIIDFRSRRNRIFWYVRRHLKHIKIVAIVNNSDRGKQAMRWGSYSFIVGGNFDDEQFRTCLISALRLDHHFCQLLRAGEACNRSCINNYLTDDDFDEMIDDTEEYQDGLEDQQFIGTGPPPPPNLIVGQTEGFFDELEQIADEIPPVPEN